MRFPDMQRQASGRPALARDAVQHDPGARDDTAIAETRPPGSNGATTRISVAGGDCARGAAGQPQAAARARRAAIPWAILIAPYLSSPGPAVFARRGTVPRAR